ncbi:response regulator [Pedobacter yulinensis]|uniref:Response regulator n=1 Tax=Pedobacter yulinensis TaxID=2126353 RepID=A0A2T3HGK8_9SPHI|nr:response regulator [Pedobacter yulinensis]PST81578.1 response regulator [Pedobacter yulinensis]
MSKKKILVIEDNHAILDVITLILQSEAFEVSGLNRGLEMMRHIETFEPHVIVMDIMLPDSDGRTLLKELRGNPQTAEIPVLMISARYHSGNYDEGGLKANDFLAKPFDIDALMDKIYALLPK